MSAGTEDGGAMSEVDVEAALQGQTKANKKRGRPVAAAHRQSAKSDAQQRIEDDDEVIEVVTTPTPKRAKTVAPISFAAPTTSSSPSTSLTNGPSATSRKALVVLMEEKSKTTFHRIVDEHLTLSTFLQTIARKVGAEVQQLSYTVAGHLITVDDDEDFNALREYVLLNHSGAPIVVRVTATPRPTEKMRAAEAKKSTITEAKDAMAAKANKSTEKEAKEATAAEAKKSAAKEAKKSTAEEAKEPTAAEAKKSTAAEAKKSTAKEAKEPMAAEAEKTTAKETTKAAEAKKLTAKEMKEATGAEAKKSTAKNTKEATAAPEGTVSCEICRRGSHPSEACPVILAGTDSVMSRLKELREIGYKRTDGESQAYSFLLKYIEEKKSSGSSNGTDDENSSESSNESSSESSSDSSSDSSSGSSDESNSQDKIERSVGSKANPHLAKKSYGFTPLSKLNPRNIQIGPSTPSEKKLPAHTSSNLESDESDDSSSVDSSDDDDEEVSKSNSSVPVNKRAGSNEKTSKTRRPRKSLLSTMSLAD